MGNKYPICACGRPKIDGRCQASPSCSDFVRPSKIGEADNVLARARIREATTIGIDLKTVAAAANRIDPRGAAAAGEARRRSLIGWSRERRAPRNSRGGR